MRFVVADAYYKAKKTPDRKQRYDVVSKHGDYPLFDVALKNKRGLNVGGLSFNFGVVPKHFNVSAQRKADRVISKGGNISSVYHPNVELPYAWGDVQNPKTKILTQDAILFIFSDDYKFIEVFVFKFKRNIARQLYQMLCDGNIDHEIDFLRHNSK